MAAEYQESEHYQRFLGVADECCQGFEILPIVSLTEAVEPVVSLVPDIKRMAFLAIETCKKPPGDGLSIDESASIFLYSMDWVPTEQCLHYVLNETLRVDKRDNLKPWLLYLKLLFTGLSRIPSFRGTVFRGIRGDVREQYLVGNTVYWRTISSCTLAMNVLKNEACLGDSGVRKMFVIECLNGKNIYQHSSFRSECEILFLPGRLLKVMASFSQGNDCYIIHLQEIDFT